MAISEQDTGQFGNDVIGVGDAKIASWLFGNVICKLLLSNLRSTIGVLDLVSIYDPNGGSVALTKATL